MLLEKVVGKNPVKGKGRRGSGGDSLGSWMIRFLWDSPVQACCLVTAKELLRFPYTLSAWAIPSRIWGLGAQLARLPRGPEPPKLCPSLGPWPLPQAPQLPLFIVSVACLLVLSAATLRQKPAKPANSPRRTKCGGS